MRVRPVVLASITCIAALAGATGAQAGPPGKWTQVTGVGKPDRNILRVGLARTPDGVLHVGWEQDGSGNSASILHSAISANAASVSGPNTIATYPGGANSQVSLVAVPGGIRAFFAGLSAGSPLDTAMATATSANGTAWTVQPTAASFGGVGAKPVYAAAGLAGALGPNGTFFSIWGDSSPNGGGFHVGLDSTAADNSLPGALKSDPGIGVDSTGGQVVAGWNIIGGGGVQVMLLSPLGVPATIPNSGAAQLQHPLGISGRIGAPGVFVAYTQGTNEFSGKPALYRVDTAKAIRVTSKVGKMVSLAAAPGGRLWVFWQNSGTVFATRSNAAATRFGAVRAIKGPGGTSATIFDLEGEGSTGPLDVLALAQPAGGPLASYHQRILPGLTLTARKKGGKTLFTVTDAGDAVAGAKVKVKGGGSGTTGKKGTVSLKLPKGKHRATASQKGYASATISARG